ncbi:class I SAM-dependent methyltransferase [Streptomyces sp. NPDC051172]|uniref:O-methyltransferase n=1 Tax=Streptomyces sp. NPDC051172 TaxID=3155796 RepID=UPI003434C646
MAAANVSRAGLDHVVGLRVGKALDALPRLVGEGAGPFDLVFIDADKPSSPACSAWTLELTRPGSIVVGDNVVRDGAVTEQAARRPDMRLTGDLLAGALDDLATILDQRFLHMGGTTTEVFAAYAADHDRKATQP